MKRSLGPRLLALSALALLPATAGTVRADPPPPRPSDGGALPGKSIASTDDASSILVNPANLAFGPGLEARFVWMHTPDSSPRAMRGYTLDLAAPFWLFGTGLELEWLRAPSAAPEPYGGHLQQWVRWALSAKAGDWLGVGTTLAWSSSREDALDRQFSVTSGLTFRPISYLSLAVVARDWNDPDNDAGERIKPSIDLGLALRPVFGHRMLEWGLGASYRGSGESWVPSTTLAVDIPYVGRLRAGAEVVDPKHFGVSASAGLDVHVDAFELAAGALFGSAHTLAGTGLYAGAAFRSFRERPDIPLTARVVRLRIESVPDARGHTALLRKLWRLSQDPEVDGVLFTMRAAPAESVAHAEELVDAVELLRRRGKKVLCHLEDATGRALFVCSAADRVAVNPAGGVRFAGLSSRYFYFGGLLDKLGVRADFVRIGLSKTAPEQFTLEGGSEQAHHDHGDILRQIEDVYLDQLARGRGLEREVVRQRIAAGPYIASEAREAGFVDELVYDDEIPRFAEDVLGRPVRIEPASRPKEAPAYWRDGPSVAVVYLDGDMIDGESRTIPLIGMKLAGSYTVARALKRAREDSSIRAVVFRIETGGGSSLASDVILREATLTAKVKPLIVSMGSKAASGGYYASVGGREIFANRATVTGSIGIFYGKVDVSGLLAKLGVRSESIESAPRADSESLFRAFTDDERATLGAKVKQFYDLFVGRVAEGRALGVAEVDAVGRGRVWSGAQALDRRLVDRLGGLRQALARARSLAGLSADAEVVELPEQQQSLLDIVLELVGVPPLFQVSSEEASAPGWIPPMLVDAARALAPFMVYDSGRPLARIELSVDGP
ncbi:MAG: signal peptide peptidase SppA [Myxococcales bacterium]|nr:signal peptide peptidase SppA [Myxococcales bacterium]